MRPASGCGQRPHRAEVEVTVDTSGRGRHRAASRRSASGRHIRAGSMAAVAAGLLTTGLLVPLLATGAAADPSPVTGAVFTTDVNGAKVNANIYGLKEDVYLNGG